MASHSQSPVPEADRPGFTGMRFFPYDPTWRLAAQVEAIDGDDAGASAPDGVFRPIGQVVAHREGRDIRLTLLWLEGYGGGLFLPFRDATCGVTTYGGGRYLLDQVKGADLGATASGELILDFNFAYHPSCAHDPRWTCPLAPAANTIGDAVNAGEMAPG